VHEVGDAGDYVSPEQTQSSSARGATATRDLLGRPSRLHLQNGGDNGATVLADFRADFRFTEERFFNKIMGQLEPCLEKPAILGRRTLSSDEP